MRNKKLTIGIDVDLTIVDTGLDWLFWLQKHFPQVKEMPLKNIDYNLSVYFGPSKTGLEHYDYWSNNHLYDDLEFMPGFESALSAWKNEGHRAIFISHTKSGHFKSKFRMLKNLPMVSFGDGKGDAFVATKEKGLLSGAVDVMIDDRIDMLNQFDDSVVKILFKTPYTQKEEPKTKFDLVSNDWNEIRSFIQDLV